MKAIGRKAACKRSGLWAGLRLWVNSPNANLPNAILPKNWASFTFQPLGELAPKISVGITRPESAE